MVYIVDHVISQVGRDMPTVSLVKVASTRASE